MENHNQRRIRRGDQRRQIKRTDQNGGNANGREGYMEEDGLLDNDIDSNNKAKWLKKDRV